jgi:hypothetical protein
LATASASLSSLLRMDLYVRPLIYHYDRRLVKRP